MRFVSKKKLAVKTFCKNIVRRFNIALCGLRMVGRWLNVWPWTGVYFGRHLNNVPDNALVFFPLNETLLCCGIAGIITVKRTAREDSLDIQALQETATQIAQHGFRACESQGLSFIDHYLGGQQEIDTLLKRVRCLKEDDRFAILYVDEGIQDQLAGMTEDLTDLEEHETQGLQERMGRLEQEDINTCTKRIEELKDITWCLKNEVTANVAKIKELISPDFTPPSPAALKVYKKINAVLNSIDRLEVRGRDSAGISLLFTYDTSDFEGLENALSGMGLTPAFDNRLNLEVLANQSLRLHRRGDRSNPSSVALAFTYKVAAEIGRLGDNIKFLRDQITTDPLLSVAVAQTHQFFTISSHTRWASIGAITEPNCHPVDNLTRGEMATAKGIIHACLNGDIDNYLDLKKAAEAEGRSFPREITTDTKIIPVQIEKYIEQGIDVPEAFRRAVNDFEGSHAITMHTDLAPGKFFLAQKGSGQAVFVGLAPDHYMPTSEVYGFIEETPFFLRMDGEKVVDGRDGKTQGQIFVLDQNSAGGTEGIQAMYYDSTPIVLGPDDIKHTEITARDIDRQSFPHYFLKEISESPVSVERTLQSRWKIDDATGQYRIALDQATFPAPLADALKADRIRRIFFMGQGTAGVASLACTNILQHYLNEPGLQINALKASELSGSYLDEHDHEASMADTLVVAISQSGTTTDTNRTVDMVKARGAYTLAIVNRRDSDITFKVDGVVYTSSGRDIEMSVASTKAFYSQIVAGAVLSLEIAAIKGRRSAAFISEEIKDLLALPKQMRSVLALGEAIAASARRHAATKTYWAAVGSGPNKASADEIRIKLSELCYKTISSDFVEDKKHIDLSSEPLIIVCAAGSKGTVIGDIIKDTAIFKAHKATPIVIADEGDDRFAPYAADVFSVPPVSPHLAPILNTLVGHIWGYYAALAINEGSRFLHEFRRDIQATIVGHTDQGLDIYEVLLEKTFREKIALFYNAFRSKRSEIQWPTAIALASDLTLLLKYLSGRLPVSDFELDFGKKGTAKNMLETLFAFLGESINQMARPVDAIKHQAKTVTVGTSRISETVEGILFEALNANGFDASHLINRNVIVLKNLQAVVSGIEGSILYEIGNLNLLGELTDETTIAVLNKTGVLKPLPSRVETDTRLKGTKKIIVRQGNVYTGKGRKDDRSIVVIPVISGRNSLNTIDHLLLLNIIFKSDVPLAAKIKALGGKFEHIKNIVQENSIEWEDAYLEKIAIDELFGRSAEKVGEYLVKALE